MLYVTTRNKFDTYTTPRANQSDRGPDGGLFQPFRLPEMDQETLRDLQGQTFTQRICYILNLFCGTQLTAWDVELYTGKNPVKLVPMNRRILIAEVWRNHDLDYAQLEKRLAIRICGESVAEQIPTSWLKIAIRIAMLFGIFGEIQKAMPGTLVDVVVACGDFSAPMAAWYARSMGLPIGNIVCSHGDSAVWDLIHHGEVRNEHPIPENLERLISETLGVEETQRFVQTREQRKVYTLHPGGLECLSKGMFASVISQQRVSALIPSVYRMAQYIMGPQTAMAYGGLQDYRAKTRDNRMALIMSDRSPSQDCTQIAQAMNMSEWNLQKIIGE